MMPYAEFRTNPSKHLKDIKLKPKVDLPDKSVSGRAPKVEPLIPDKVVDFQVSKA